MMENSDFLGGSMPPARRLLLVLSTAAVVLAVYICVVHASLERAASKARETYEVKKLEKYRLLDCEAAERKIRQMRQEMERLGKTLAALGEMDGGADVREIKKALIDEFSALNEWTGESLRFNPAGSFPEALASPGSVRSPVELGGFRFKLQGSIEGQLRFMELLPHLPGVPLRWMLEKNEGDDPMPFTLWMEIDP